MLLVEQLLVKICHCIRGVSDTEQAMAALLGLVHKAWVVCMLLCLCHCRGVSWSSPHLLCCLLVNVKTEITLQPVRRRYMILHVTQNKRHHGMRGKRKLSKDILCAVCHGESIWGSVQRCTKGGFPASDRT